MMTLSTHRRSLRVLLALSLPLSLGACGGAAPVHTGYPEGEASPWERAGKLNLNDSLEASAEGELSFPKRVRAKWYALDLPAPGKLTARISIEPTVKGSDVGFEILDAGFNVNAEGINDDDVGQPKKTREYKDARQGKSYIHIYTLGRDDVVGYTLRVHFDPKPQARVEAPMEPATADRTTFPWTVPNLPALPQIGKGGGGGSTVVTRETPPPPPDPNAGFNLIKATITEFSDTGNGVRIILNKGQNASLDGGLEGEVLSGGKPLPSGHFKLRTCKQDECDAVVPKATMDQIQANRAVIVKVPK